MIKAAGAIICICLAFINTSISAQQVDTTALKEGTQLPTKEVTLLYPSYNNLFAHIYNSLSPALAEDISGKGYNRITLDFDFEGNSNAAPNAIPFGLLLNNEISRKVRERGLNRLKDNLKYEDDLNTGVSYRRFLPKLGSMLLVQYKFRTSRNLLAPKDAYQVIFFGNAGFENQRADLSNIKFQNYLYNQFTVGMRRTFRYNKVNVTAGAALSVLQVFNQQDISTKEAWIYTGPDGEYLDFKYDLTFNAAAEGAVKYTDWNGIGGSGELYLDVSQTNNWKIAADISDLGFMRFRSNDKHKTVNYSGVRDSTRFQGIVLPNLTEITSLTFDTLKVDSTLRALLPGKSNNEYKLFMPFTVNLVVAKYLNIVGQRFVISAGVQYKHLKDYKAYGFGKINYMVNEHHYVATSFGGGGYSRFNWGVEYGLSYKHIDATIGSANIIGLVAPAAYQGGSIYFRVGTTF
jgi:hypothetical protein